MCGLAGFVDSSAASTYEALVSSVSAMADTLRHRGPDDGGAWIDPSAGIALGHRRLSIIDLSPEGRQPMHAASGRYVLIFNGEIYNFGDLRCQLETLGHAFRGRSDTEVMLAAFSQWNVEEALRRFNGMFAFVLWDRQNRVLHLARDRMGKKPLYYGWAGPIFLFGSELKALRAHPRFPADVDRGALQLFLRHGYIPAPHSIFQGIFKLPAGMRLVVDPQRPGHLPPPTAYWSAGNTIEQACARPFTGGEQDAVTEIDGLLRDAIRIRMIADVPLGAFLSGGIDSSLVVALMQAQSARPVRTFSIGFHERGYDEAPAAAAVARFLSTDHTEVYVTPAEAMDVIPRLPVLYDEPFADASQIPTFLVSQIARRHVTVALSGDGGDELFGGYRTYLSGIRLRQKLAVLPAPARAALSSALRRCPAAWQALHRALRAVLPARISRRIPSHLKAARVLAAQDPAMLFRGLLSDWQDPFPVAGSHNELPTHFTDPALRPPLSDFVQLMMYLDTVMYLPDDILAKVDRASMGVSLETRAPILDYRVAEFAWRLPLSMRIRGGIGKWILREVLHRYVPPALVDRPKAGFCLPYGEWIRGPLRDWAGALLDANLLRRQGFLQPEPICRQWTAHLAGAENNSARLWPVLMFQAWLENSTMRSAAAASSTGIAL